MRTLENKCINTLEQYFCFQPRSALNIRPRDGHFDFLLYKIIKSDYSPIKKEILSKINIRLLYIKLCSTDSSILTPIQSDSYIGSFNIQLAMIEKRTNWLANYNRGFYESNISEARISFKKVLCLVGLSIRKKLG